MSLLLFIPMTILADLAEKAYHRLTRPKTFRGGSIHWFEKT